MINRVVFKMVVRGDVFVLPDQQPKFQRYIIMLVCLFSIVNIIITMENASLSTEPINALNTTLYMWCTDNTDEKPQFSLCRVFLRGYRPTY